MKSTFPLELLSPVGDMERLKAAVAYGADAVYLGSNEFTMRSAPTNFTAEQLKEGVAFAHENGVKVYLTCNTLPRGEELAALPAFFEGAAAAGVDAFIIADIGVMMAAKRCAPNVPIHMSTQTGIVNALTATELYHLGASRVVLARELSLEEIRGIRENTPPELELEAFVHGAMCVSFSGRCLLSNYILGRDANRGECAQPCRWGYHLMEEKRPGEFYPIYEDESGTFILNAKDMCMIEHIDKLAAAGITSFKIEGRAKSAYYVSVVTNAYRAAIDLYEGDPGHYQCPQWLMDEVRKVSHRQYCEGFYFGRPDNSQYYENGGYLRQWEVVAMVEGYADGSIEATQRNKFSVGDVVEVLEPKGRPEAFTIEAILDGEGQPVDNAPHPMMAVRIPFHRPVKPGAIIRREKKE